MSNIFWTNARIQRASFALTFGLLISLVFIAMCVRPLPLMLNRGDFPPFYAAASIMRTGNPAQLYDVQTHSTIQNEHWPLLDGDYLAYAYPPYVALLLSPMSKVGGVRAKLLFTALMFCFFVSAVLLSRTYLPCVKSHLLRSVILLFFFGPVFCGVLSGQNVPLSMCMYSMAIAALISGEKRDEYIAGLMFGLWCFKPHFGLIAVGLFFIACRWRVVFGAMGPIICYYLLGVIAVDWSWPVFWIGAIEKFAELDAQFNGYQMVSLTAFSAACAKCLGSWHTFCGVAGWVVELFLLGAVVFRFWSYGRNFNSVENRASLALLLGPSIVLLSPHTLFYDLGITVFSFLYYVRAQTDREISAIAVLLILSMALCITRSSFCVSPLFAFSLVVFVMAYQGGRFASK